MYACSFLFSYQSLADGGRASSPVLHQTRLFPGSAAGQKRNISGRRPHLQRRAASVQLALGGGGAGPPLSPFSCNSNLGKIRANSMDARMVMFSVGTK